MILKIGRIYKDRRGQMWKVTQENNNTIFQYSAINLDLGGFSNTFTAEGRYTVTGGDSDYDLIAEVSEGDRMLNFFAKKQDGYWKEWWDAYDY